MNTELKKWAESIIAYCNPIAIKNNFEYYPLQSSVNEKNTEILIVGVNPRSSGNHKSQSENEKWEFINGEMSSDKLLKGNPYFMNDNSWRFFNNLKQVEFLKKVIEQGHFTYMNYFYFSTKDAVEMKKIENFNEIVKFSIEKLNEIIEILKPKVVVVLGVSDGLDIITVNKTIVSKGGKRILTKGFINGNVIYGIPHSSRNYAYDVREILSVNLSEIYNNKEITPFQIPDKSNNKSIVKKNLNINIINENLKEFGFSFKEYNDKKSIFNAEYKGINKDALDFRIDIKDGYFAFRSLEKVNNSFFELKGKENYKKIFSENAEIEKHSWLVYKTFQNYNTNESIEDQISNDLKKLLSNIQ